MHLPGLIYKICGLWVFFNVEEFIIDYFQNTLFDIFRIPALFPEIYSLKIRR